MMSGTRKEQKRPRSTPTYLTPTRPRKRVPLRVLDSSPQCKGRLPFQDQDQDQQGADSEAQAAASASDIIVSKAGSFPRKPPAAWSEAEIKALVTFILYNCGGNKSKWPSHNHWEFWRSAACFVQTQAKSASQRSGSSCRYKVVGWLKKNFDQPKDAEAFYFSVQKSSIGVQTKTTTRTKNAGVQTSNGSARVNVGIQAVMSDIIDQTAIATPTSRVEEPTGETPSLEFLSAMFSKHCIENLHLEVPNDFLKLSASAMVRLKNNCRTNVVYNLAKGVGTERSDGKDSCFPVTRMPMGLVEYVANFFTITDINQISRCPDDYRTWLQTMYCQFGQKWAKLHHGPMWSVSTLHGTSNQKERNTMQALVNVPSISESTLRRDIASSGVSLDAQIQLSVLDEASLVHPNTWWWIKADGVDLVSGLGESVRGIWSGDIDLADGSLKKAYELHQQRLEFLTIIGIGDRADSTLILKDMKAAGQLITQDIEHISLCLRKTSKTYGEKQAAGTTVEKDMFKLAWDVEELSRLGESGRKLFVECSALSEKLMEPGYDRVADNFAKKLSTFRQHAAQFLKGAVRYKRTPATHVLVMMISPEERNRKPYALPVQCLAYDSLQDETVRSISNSLIQEMSARGMKVAGFVTNGEWNSLRSKGSERPVSIFEIRAQVRRKYSRLNVSALTGMLTPTISVDGSTQASIPHYGVSESLLKEVAAWLEEGCTMKDVVVRLRQRTVPAGHSYHSWTVGKKEGHADMLRSILAQLEYTARVRQYSSQGVPFDKHMHVPEVHKCTGEVVCQREDEGHIFKRIANSLRQGRVEEIGLERFAEALEDPSTGLTVPALTGIRKQSVQDVERLFGQGVIKFMEEKQYNPEAKYLKTVRNWRRAIDERGLTETTRQKFIEDFKDFICEDLVPWYSISIKDFSTMEVNRPLDKVRGFTRETLIGVTADIETRLWRHKFNLSHNIPPEHPRSSTTDDVECFFSVLRDCVGKDFTLKQVYFGWRKITQEFVKRMDPALPFYYFTSDHQRFYEGELPGFNEPTEREKTVRAPRRELRVPGLCRRATFPVRGSLSVRATFHNTPVNLPPPPSASVPSRLAAEHSYAQH